MKKYDREKKEWISEDEHISRQKKRDKRCHGGKEHDFVEVLPYGVEANEKYQGSTEPYYKALKEIDAFVDKKHEELAQLGILIRTKPWRPNMRMFMCSVCKKKRYETSK